MRTSSTVGRRVEVSGESLCAVLQGSFDDLRLSGLDSQSLKRRSLHLTRNIAGSVGGYLPNTLTEMWEPSRDFAFLKLPTSGARCIVALSGYALFLLSLHNYESLATSL